jgi:hypothetical protein
MKWKSNRSQTAKDTADGTTNPVQSNQQILMDFESIGEYL